jgi:phosphoserine phosphatase
VKENIILIDICGTIYSSNTTFDFMDYIFSRDEKYMRFRYISQYWLIKYINIVFLKLFKFDFVRYCLIVFLSGYSRIEIEKNVEFFMENILEDRKYHNIIEIINKLNIPENKLILVSATLDCIAAQVASKLNITEFHASELEYRNNICTGKIKHDLLFHKLERILREGYLPPYNVTISDNVSDINLMKNSAFSYIIVSKKNEKKWYSILKKKSLGSYEIVKV